MRGINDEQIRMIELTVGETQFIMEVLQECSEYHDDLESGCEEALNILKAARNSYEHNASNR